MKILMVTHRYAPDVGGVQTHVRQLAEGLVGLGHEVEVLTTRAGLRAPQREEGSIPVERHPALAPGNAYYYSSSLARSVRQRSGSFDILHAHNYQAFPALHAFRHRHETPFVFTGHYHGGGHTFLREALHGPYKWIARGLFEKADGLVFVSAAERDIAARAFHLAAPQRVIPNGLDLAEFVRMKRQGRPGHLLVMGRLEPYKRVDAAIRAIAALPTWNLTIVGDGTARPYLERLAQDVGVTDRVKFRGVLPRKEVLDELAACQAVVTLSGKEAFGIVVLEAVAAGRPVFVSPIDSHRELAARFPHHVRVLGSATAESLSEALRAPFESPGDPPNLAPFSWARVAEATAEFYGVVAA